MILAFLVGFVMRPFVERKFRQLAHRADRWFRWRLSRNVEPSASQTWDIGRTVIDVTGVQNGLIRCWFDMRSAVYFTPAEWTQFVDHNRAFLVGLV